MSQWQQDWNAFFSNQVAAGTRQDLGNGSWVTKNADGTATYGDSSGASVWFNKNTDPGQLAQQASGLAQQWGSTYGGYAPPPAPPPAPPSTGSNSYGANFTNDWNAFFSNQVAAGTRQDLGNGSWVTKNADGTATYQDNSGGYFNFDKNSNPSHVGRNAQGLLSQWNKTYVTDTYAPGGAQQRTDPAATGFTLNANGTVTRKGTNPDVKPNEMYGDYTTRNSINNVKNAEARAYYQANPDAFLTTEATGQDPDTFFIRYFYNTNYGRPAGEWGGPGASSLNNGGNTAGGSGGSALGGPGAGATVGGGSSGSSGGTGSGTSSGRDVNYGTDTIEGRVYGLMATDRYGNYTNPVLQQAADNAMKSFASRGLLNSSMAQQAAYQAALGEAIKIAGPDAQTYFSQGRANQDASNVFKRDENQYKEDRWKIDQQLSLEREKMAQNMGQFNQELAYKYDALKLDKDTRAEAEARAQKYALEIKNIDAVNGAYDLYLRRIQDIDMNKDLSGPNKIEMKNQAGKDFDLYAKAKGIAWEMGLGSRFAASTADAKVQESVQGGMLSSAGGGGS